jgi:gluconolactonase
MTVETLAFGYSLIEGPRVDADGALYFSDVHNGGVRRLNPDGSIEVVVPKRRGVGGISLHADGGIVISGKNICHVRDGETRILYERDDVGGFNDLYVDAQGRVITGSLRRDPFGTDAGTPGDAYRIDAPGEAVTLYTGVGLTNGIGFSPDGRRLYHVDSSVNSILVHDVDASGDIVPDSGATFVRVEKATPDGLAVDSDGGVWVALVNKGCVGRFAPDGTLDRQIDVPSQFVTSLCFTGPHRDELIVVTADNTEDESRGGTIFRVSADAVGAKGLPAPLATI